MRSNLRIRKVLFENMWVNKNFNINDGHCPSLIHVAVRAASGGESGTLQLTRRFSPPRIRYWSTQVADLKGVLFTVLEPQSVTAAY